MHSQTIEYLWLLFQWLTCQVGYPQSFTAVASFRLALVCLAVLSSRSASPFQSNDAVRLGRQDSGKARLASSIRHFDAWSPRRNVCERRTVSPCWCLFLEIRIVFPLGVLFLGWNARCHSLTGWRALHPLLGSCHSAFTHVNGIYSTVCCIPHSPTCPMTSLAYSRQTASDAPWWNLSRYSFLFWWLKTALAIALTINLSPLTRCPWLSTFTYDG